MVAEHPEKNPEAMVSRMRGANSRHLIADEMAAFIPPPVAAVPHALDFNIEIRAKDGALLLRLFERGGQLACEGDQSRMEEGAKIFLYQMLQWSGQVKLRWKDDVIAEAEGR